MTGSGYTTNVFPSPQPFPSGLRPAAQMEYNQLCNVCDLLGDKIAIKHAGDVAINCMLSTFSEFPG